MAYRKVDNFPAYQASSTQKQILRNLPPVHELRSVLVTFYFTIISTAAAFLAAVKPNDGSAAGGTNDTLALLNAMISRVYIKAFGQERQFNAAPIDFVIAYGGQTGRHALADFIRDGDSIPVSTGTALKAQICVPITFMHDGLETPNKFCPGTEQALLDGGWEVSFDSVGTGLAPVTLKNGSATVVMGNVELGVDVEPTESPIVASPWSLQNDTTTTENYESLGAQVELLLYDKTLPPAFDAIVTTLNVKNEGVVDEVLSAKPSTVASQYGRAQGNVDGTNPFNVERNCTPLRFVKSRVKAEEREYPITLSKRNVNFQGSTGSRALIRHRINPFKEVAGQAVAVMGQYGVGGSWQDLDKRFPGRDGIIDEIFASRLIRSPRSKSRKS